MTGDDGLWTAGRDFEQNPGKHVWCSKKYEETDYVKNNLYFSGTKVNDSCIHIQFENASALKHFEPKLEYGSCSRRRNFLCEVTFETKIMHTHMHNTTQLQMHGNLYDECLATYSLNKSG
jgi:hypothetical protein